MASSTATSVFLAFYVLTCVSSGQKLTENITGTETFQEVEAPTTAAPSLSAGQNHTAPPVNTDTVLPENNDTALPENTDTALPVNNDTALPVNNDTVLPENTDTVLPANNDTALLVNNASSELPELSFTGDNSSSPFISLRQESIIPLICAVDCDLDVTSNECRCDVTENTTTELSSPNVTSV